MKTTNWTPEELAEMRRQRSRDHWPAYELDARGHKVHVKTPWQGHVCPEYEHCALCVEEAWDCAAAVAFGLMGMAEAIRERYEPTEEEIRLDAALEATWGRS